MSKIDDQFPGSEMFDLRGKQSVRATFKLSQRAIDAIGLVAIHMGIKQKSLFDHITEDLKALDSIARKVRISKFKQIPRKQKTFVLSRRTIDALGSISREHGTPRDALVEYSIQKLESLIESEKLRHQERTLLEKEVAKDILQMEKTYQKARAVLGKEDPFCRKLARGVFALKKTQQELNEFLEKSKVLESY